MTFLGAGSISIINQGIISVPEEYKSFGDAFMREMIGRNMNYNNIDKNKIQYMNKLCNE